MPETGQPGRLERIGRWYLRQPRVRRATLRAGPVAVATYGSALLAGLVAQSLSLHHFVQFLVVTAGVVIGVVLAVLVGQLFIAVIEGLRHRDEAQQRALGAAYDFADRWMLGELKELTAIACETKKPVLLAPVEPLVAFANLVQAAYDVLTANFGQAERLDERIQFEVTFMTKSYADDEITIAAWANHDDRKPTSMQQRPTNPNVYDRTVTADIYRAARPEMRIVEDTSVPQSGYAELYAGQKERIKSSVVHPVLSSEYGLLGTLVLHCDKPGFFAERDQKFWRMFCEIFAKRLALAKLLLDAAMKATGDENLGARHWDKPPF